MTQQDYEQKRRECWIEFCKGHPIETPSMAIGEAFCYAFDRAYALGKIDGANEQKECSDRSMKIQKICAELKESCNKLDQAIRKL